MAPIKFSETVRELVKRSLLRASAHGLPRLVTEKFTYTRVLWLLAWLACCAGFLRQFAGFITKLRDNEVTTNFQSNTAAFLYPDLYICYDSPLSGSRHLALNDSAIKFINATFEAAAKFMDDLQDDLTVTERDYMNDNELAMMKMNSLPFRFLVDQLGQTMQQSVLNASIVRVSGILNSYRPLRLTEFHHPSHLRCFKVLLNDTERAELQLAGPNRALYFQLMLDAADSRMGTSALPRLETPVGNLTAPYWALDKETLYWLDRWSAAKLYITEPGHYPSRFDTTVSLEAGRSYNVQLRMSEEVRKDDPSRCVDQHSDVQVVNPYNNSPYTVAYDYAHCYNNAQQAQFQRELNATCGFLPQPWPPAQRLLYNLSSSWGSLRDVRNFLSGKERLALDEPRKMCETARRCVERTYTAAVSNVLWPSADSLRVFLRDLELPNEDSMPQLPALAYLKQLIRGPNSSLDLAGDFVRSNFLQLHLTVKSPTGDRTIFVRSYSFESFVADVGGILGIYLGMSVLTACDIVQFLHDLARMLCVPSKKRGRNIDLTDGNEKSSKTGSGPSPDCAIFEPPVVFNGQAVELPT